MAGGVGEALVSAVLKEVLGKLGSAVGEQIVMRWNLKQDLESIKSTLGMLQAVLRDAERRSVSDEGASLWLKRLKNAAYDISDMLDEFEAKLSEVKKCPPARMSSFTSVLCLSMLLPSKKI
ncbi:Os02g0597200 [Oryza sativa Japonica Group]|jgi:hypothetical protein|uniref:Os02g0597200 protein n=3 Tax=Oryza TaxID=4527 RepID=Q6K906_ORYSJ|nr:hypothetical protein EE612_012208 [Oryza sativa]BAD21627.1 NBS-LRR disease resistance protein-like [Oryza sativa Japonica Group]BAG89267.1 unnamed protein product [Oryza sativa Japonica Group]BAS79562.1 Os02g0597200 [Oryza sativa Japonica Group]